MWRAIWVALFWGAMASTMPGAAPSPQPASAAPATGQLPQPIYTRQMAFTLPFRLMQGATQPAEVQLWVSTDEGQTWNVYARRHPSTGEFPFQAERDGRFWLATRTVDAAGHVHPADALRPELIVVVDTQPPQLQLDARAGSAGQVIAQWQVSDPNLDPASLLIQQQTVAPGQQLDSWQTVAIDRPSAAAEQTRLTGEASWWPGEAIRMLHVRATVKDRAGNVAQVNRQVTTPAITANRPVSSARSRPLQPLPPAGPTRLAQPPAEPSASPSHPPWVQPSDRPVRMTNRQRIKLHYHVDAAAEDTGRRVELWATEDGGHSWRLWGVDPDGQSPMIVDLDHEGVYGFRIVVANSDGPSDAKPRSGEEADLRVALDMTRPVARIVSAPFGTDSESGQLVIHWTSQDDHLSPQPVRLLYSAEPGGPWSTIADGLPAVGQYRWRLDERLPAQVYLRLEARDQAGNVGTDQLSQPIRLQRLAPRGRIVDFEPVDP